ncbi:hypothetical protein [Pseudonocardia acidicola]|uniref:Uncharacterized protein n=1 Tax=Pseudonocardia acidicola TaxID=2724939 RepID=A0ABX1S9J3_9PSEU|nr:hypothetical protein [Pseudonocardia acidicola]NMH97021.1 hypothetical protein [Pseudonocardia acidicola]
MATDSVLKVCIGPVSVDVPRSLGYYTGVWVAVTAGLVEPPLGVFIAAVPFIKLLTHHALPIVVRAVGQFLEGAAKPVGGDDEAVFTLEDEQKDAEEAERVAQQLELARRLHLVRG